MSISIIVGFIIGVITVSVIMIIGTIARQICGELLQLRASGLFKGKSFKECIHIILCHFFERFHEYEEKVDDGFPVTYYKRCKWCEDTVVTCRDFRVCPKCKSYIEKYEDTYENRGLYLVSTYKFRCRNCGETYVYHSKWNE